MKCNRAVVWILKEIEKLEIEKILFRHKAPSRFGPYSVFYVLLLQSVDAEAAQQLLVRFLSCFRVQLVGYEY